MRKYTCIVVEDEDPIRKNITKKILHSSLPLHVSGEAYDGREAMRLIEEDPPDIVVTDIQMPVMDGLELCDELYFAYPRIFKIIITGHNDFDYAQRAIRYGVEDFILKPVSDSELFSALHRVTVKLDARYTEIAALRLPVNTEPKEAERIIVAVETFIRENYRSQISLGDLAEKVGYTADYLSKLFKKMRNESPSRLLLKLRMNEAKYLLANHPEYEVKEISEIVGYSEPSYFSRVFKSYTGIYPSEYRMQK
ncbi:MAG: response regulator [Oscillospiraceae bacterium]|nr:response regulator [Oscillospiraceae bacterium]